VTTIRLPREQRIGVASQAYRGIRRRQGIGFASAIETGDLVNCEDTFLDVARGLASRLRLKLSKPSYSWTHLWSRQGIGFASAIETACFAVCVIKFFRRQGIGFASAIETIRKAG